MVPVPLARGRAGSKLSGPPARLAELLNSSEMCGAVLLTPVVSHQAGPAAALPLGHQDLRVPAPLGDPGRQPHPGPLGLLQGKDASWKALPVCGHAETSLVMPFQVQQKDKSDEEVAHAINQKLGDTPGISYSEIAARAYDCGRTELAIKVFWLALWRVQLGGGMAGGVTRGGHMLMTPLLPAAAGV